MFSDEHCNGNPTAVSEGTLDFLWNAQAWAAFIIANDIFMFWKVFCHDRSIKIEKLRTCAKAFSFGYTDSQGNKVKEAN